EIVGHPPDLQVSEAQAPIVVVPIRAWDTISERAMRFALRVSGEIIAVHVTAEENPSELLETWAEKVEGPAQRAGLRPPKLELMVSPYRQFYRPILDFVDRIADEHPSRTIAVVIPELVRPRWWEALLHNQGATGLKAALLLKRAERVVVISTPWYLRD